MELPPQPVNYDELYDKLNHSVSEYVKPTQQAQSSGSTLEALKSPYAYVAGFLVIVFFVSVIAKPGFLTTVDPEDPEKNNLNMTKVFVFLLVLSAVSFGSLHYLRTR